ncbi:MAG: site-specific integrase [Sporichthyaceae bacterium]|nr:site-specific integrase [Sporichthyaceae bacterium]
MIYLFGARVVGPLEPYVVGYCECLARLGFTEATRAHHMSLVAHLSRWLAGERHEAGDLTVEVAHRYVGVRAAAGYCEFRSLRSLDRLLAYLRGVGAAPTAPAVVLTATDVLVDRFRAHLLSERGLRPNGAASYVASVLPFVARVAPDGSIDSSKVTARDVMTFLSELARSLAPGTVQRRASALRALLRFWFLDGAIGADLSVAVPKVAHRPAALPRGLPAEQVAALLAACNTGCANGLRDRAILTLLARMGLRAGEVAGLRLDDLDWRQGEVVVHGKGGHVGRLPLPTDVGQALVAYLKAGRPVDALDRRVFIRGRAPRCGLTRIGVTEVVMHAAHRAGLDTIYAHRLRHSAATGMLAAGAPLVEIGQVLRHASVSTTAIYAKVDTEALRALAMPWPGEETR